MLAVTGGHHNLVSFESGLLFDELGERFAACHAVEDPQRMRELGTEFRGGERVFLQRCEVMEEILDSILMHEGAVAFGGEELVEVERIFFVLTIIVHVGTFTNLARDHVGHTIGVHLHARKHLVWIRVLTVGASLLRLLLVHVRPVEDLVVREPALGKCLEWGAGQVQRVFAVDSVECLFGQGGINAFL